jgi:hypothetical protein
MAIEAAASEVRQIQLVPARPPHFDELEQCFREPKKHTPATIMYVRRNIAPNQEHQNGKRNSEMV